MWSAVAAVDLSAVAVAIGWNKSCTALAAVLANGSLSVYAVRDEPLDTSRRRPAQKSRDSRRILAYPRWSPDAVRPIACHQKLTELFGGQLRCATVAPGHLDPSTIAFVTVSANDPYRLNVWQVSIPKDDLAVCEVKPLSSTEMNPVEDGRCVACAAVPKVGMLLAVGDRGVISHWFLKNQRPVGEWEPQQKTSIDKATKDAVARGVIPRIEDNQNAMVNAITRGLQTSRRRKVYAFEVSFDSKTIVTSTSAGLFIWDVEKLNIIGGYPLKAAPGVEVSPYWGLCISPGGAAVLALNGKGRVDTYSLIPPIARDASDTVANAAMNVSRRLVATTYTDGLRGGWDLIAAVASQGPSAANAVGKALIPNNMRNIQNLPVSSEKLANLKSLMMRIVNVQDSTAHAAKRLLDVAIDAIRQSAPDNVKLKLMMGAKEAKQLAAADSIQKLIEQGLSASRVHMLQLAAAPLADWIMVMSTVWLQRCAAAVARHESKPQLGTAWTGLVSRTPLDSQTGGGGGMVGDPMLIHNLRSAATAAVVLVALENVHGEPEADPRYFRFSREQGAQVVAALWDVSVAWNSGESGSRPMANGTPPSASESGPTAEHVRNAAQAFQRHEATALAIASAEKLQLVAAEKALGLHGSAIGAGFITSCIRKPYSSLTDNKAPDMKGDMTPPKTEWCPYDLVTGRPLPPWAPLRRCIASGLLAAEITQPKSDAVPPMNSASPWISKWANESPFGGRWARVPSLDLDRFELLPSVGSNRPDHMNINPAATQQQKQEDIVAQQNALANGMPPGRPMMRGVPTMANQQFAVNAAGNLNAAALAAAGAGNPMAQMLGNANHQLQQGMHGLPANAIMQGALANQMAAATGRVHASPRMSTASSTTDAGSNISKAAKKRASAQSKSTRPRKRMTMEQRMQTASQLSDLNRGMTLSGLQTSASAAQYGRNVTASDAMSTDTRSTMTTATNATGGVDQDTSKTGRRRKRSSKKQQAIDAASQAASAAAAAAAAHAASAGGGMAPTAHGTLPPGMPLAMNQTSPPSHAPQTPRSAALAKKRQIRGNQRSHIFAAAHAAAAAAAAAGAGGTKQSAMMRNAAMLQGAQSPEALAAAGMSKNVDAMSPLAFVAGNPGVPGAGNAMPAHVRRAGVPPGGNVAMMGNGNANLALNGLLQQGNFGVQGVGDGGLSNLNGQAQAEMAGMQQMAGVAGGGGNNAPNAAIGASLAAIAMRLGIKPNQFTSLTPEQAEEMHQALQRRVNIQNAAGQGTGSIHGTPPTATANVNLLGNMSAALTATDMNNNAAAAAAAAGVGRMSSTSAALALGAAGAQAGRGMVNNAAAAAAAAAGMGSMGMPMTVPRTSGTESQTSARVANGHLSAPGIPGTPSQSAMDRDTSATGGVVGRMPAGAANSAQTTGGLNNGGDNDRLVVWTGELHLVGQNQDMVRSIVAVQHDLDTKPQIRDTSGWPRQLELDSKKLKPSADLLGLMSMPDSQWYVRFAAVDKNGQEREDLQVSGLAMMIVEKKMAFQVDFDEGVGTPGTLFVWGMNLEPYGPSLLGVFKPDEQRSFPLGVDQELQLQVAGML